MKLKFWVKEEPIIDPFLKTIQYLETAEFYEMYNSKPVEEQKLIRKKISILFDCVDEYKSALEYEIKNRELEEVKNQWSKP